MDKSIRQNQLQVLESLFNEIYQIKFDLFKEVLGKTELMGGKQFWYFYKENYYPVQKFLNKVLNEIKMERNKFVF